MNLKNTALTLGLISQLCSPLVWAADDHKVTRSLDEIVIAKEQTQLVMRQSTSNEQKERLRYVSDRLTSAEELLRQALNGGGGPLPPPRPPQYGEAVELYHSDSCSGSEIAMVSSLTNCDLFEQTGSAAWAVKVGNKCHNINDTAPALACRAFKSAASPYAVKIYHSDSCSGNLTAVVDYRTRCEDLRGLPDAWGIEANGRCENISDIDIVQACERFKQ